MSQKLPASCATFRLTVRSHELDSYSHVNNAVYQQWFEEGREELLRAGGRDYDWYPANLGLQIVVVRTEIDFRLGARRRTVCDVHTRLARIGDRSVVFEQAAVRDDGALLAEARTVMVFVKDGRSVPIPGDFTARFAVASEPRSPRPARTAAAPPRRSRSKRTRPPSRPNRRGR